MHRSRMRAPRRRSSNSTSNAWLSRTRRTNSTLPHRLKRILIIFAASVCLYFIGWMLVGRHSRTLTRGLIVSSFAAGWRIQRRVIGALMIRELVTRFGRENIGFLWMMVEPLLFAGLVGIMWRYMKGPEDARGQRRRFRRERLHSPDVVPKFGGRSRPCFQRQRQLDVPSANQGPRFHLRAVF